MAKENDTSNGPGHKSHRSRKSGASAKKNSKSKPITGEGEQKKINNPKAFAFTSTVKAKRKHELQRRSSGSFMFLQLIVPQVGKSLLIKCLVKHYTKQNLPEVRGPITIVSGKQRRLQFVECPNDINGMIDCAKFADLALLLIDGSYGFEMKPSSVLPFGRNFRSCSVRPINWNFLKLGVSVVSSVETREFF